MFSILLSVIILAASTYFFWRMPHGSNIALNPEAFQKFKLISRTPVSGDTFIFRFALHNDQQTLGLPVGHHITLRAPIKNDSGEVEMIQHAYTPISSDDEKGYVDFLIKVYLPNATFPKGGRLTKYLYNLPIGSSIEMKGPHGKFTYLGNGKYELTRGSNKESHHVDAFAMIAGGSGITPIMQIIRAIQRDSEDRTQCFLIFANQTDKDILLRDELDLLAKTDSRFHIWYTVSRDVSPDWKYSTGYVTEEMARAHLPVPSCFGTDEVPQNKGVYSAAGLMCGPLPMLKNASKPSLEKLGYKEREIIAF